MGKADEYYAKHVGFAIGVHFFAGLGIAWLISLVWHYSIIALVLGIVFAVASGAGRLYAQFAKR
jgi:hypothetical protein